MRKDDPPAATARCQHAPLPDRCTKSPLWKHPQHVDQRRQAERKEHHGQHVLHQAHPALLHDASSSTLDRPAGSLDLVVTELLHVVDDTVELRQQHSLRLVPLRAPFPALLRFLLLLCSLSREGLYL